MEKIITITLALLSLFSCNNEDKRLESKKDALLELKDLYSEMSRIEKDSINNPIPRSKDGKEFFEISYHATKMNDSCIEKVVLINQKFNKYIDSGRIKGVDMVDLVIETIRLKRFLALYIHRSKLNRSFDTEYINIRQESYLSPKSAIKLYLESDIIVKNGIHALEEHTVSSSDAFITSWNSFVKSWNKANNGKEYDGK